MARSTRTIAWVLILSTTSLQAADDLYNWRCPYNTDGSCPPRRQQYGHFAPKWSRWPGVSDADYESKIPPSERATLPPPADVPPRQTPLEMLLPPDPTAGRRDPASRPPGGPGAPGGPSGLGGPGGAEPPPLTPEEEPRPDILSPPGEDIMDELLPEEPPRRRPSADPAPEPLPEFREEPTPEGDTDFEIPSDEDPFKDDPLFDDDDAAPAPPDSSEDDSFERHFESPSRGRSPGMPAMHGVPARLPMTTGRAMPSNISNESSQEKPWPEPAVEQGPRLSPASRPALRTSAGRPVVRGTLAGHTRDGSNPLRRSAGVNLLEDDQEILPTAAWQAPEPVAPPPRPQAPVRPNPLRN